MTSALKDDFRFHCRLVQLLIASRGWLEEKLGDEEFQRRVAMQRTIERNAKRYAREVLPGDGD